jgi:hypothetical protein
MPPLIFPSAEVRRHYQRHVAWCAARAASWRPATLAPFFIFLHPSFYCIYEMFLPPSRACASLDNSRMRSQKEAFQAPQLAPAASLDTPYCRGYQAGLLGRDDEATYTSASTGSITRSDSGQCQPPNSRRHVIPGLVTYWPVRY